MKNPVDNFYSDEESGEEKQMKMTKPEAFKWFETKTEFILAELQSSGYRIEPQPLPSLAPLFKKFRDELQNGPFMNNYYQKNQTDLISHPECVEIKNILYKTVPSVEQVQFFITKSVV